MYRQNVATLPLSCTCRRNYSGPKDYVFTDCAPNTTDRKDQVKSRAPFCYVYFGSCSDDTGFKSKYKGQLS